MCHAVYSEFGSNQTERIRSENLFGTAIEEL